MAHKAVIQFLQATSTDKSLRDGLSSLIGVGDGDISSAKELDAEEAQALLGKRGVLVTAFAEDHGYKFTLAELNTVVSVVQQYQKGTLSEKDFLRVMGWESLPDQGTIKLESVGSAVEMVYRGVKFSASQGGESAHQVLQFMQKTSDDEEFREQLKAILEVGDGDVSDFSKLDADELQALTGARGALVAEFAARHGFLFTMSDLLAVTNAFQRVQSGELTEDEFQKFLSLEANSKAYFPSIQNVVTMTYKGVKYSSPVVSKANDNSLPVVRFMESSGVDPAIREKLMAIIGGDGDISSPDALDSGEAAAMESERGKQIVKLGAEYGYRFTLADLSAVVGAFQLVNGGKLSMESCVRILGLGKASDTVTNAKKAAGMIYRGVRY
jgi:Ca2+-binding EF-hand superfamily protein